MAELTPMMKQYLQIKEQNQDAILFFRLGDFYEMFGDDARKASKELDLTLTTRDKDKNKPFEEKVPMCGIPYHASDAYIARLIAKGYKVAICEQTQDPATAKGLVDRDIIRVVTPGTVIDAACLEEGRSNFCAGLYLDDTCAGFSVCDISTGKTHVTAFQGPDRAEHLLNELGRFSPAEAVVNPAAYQCGPLLSLLQDKLHCHVERLSAGRFQLQEAERTVRTQFGDEAAGRLPKGNPAAALSLGALLGYLHETQKTDLRHVDDLDYYQQGQFMELDLTARRNLELTETLRSKEKKGSLLWVLDKTKTPMGGRMLRSWLERPLLSVTAITRRNGAVGQLVDHTMVREELALALTGSRSALLFGAVILALCGVYLMRHGVISRRCLTALAVAAGIAVLAAGPVVLQWVLHSRMGEDIQDSNSDRLQFLARAVDDFLRHPVFGIGLCSTRNADVFSGVEGSMVFYHNSVAQVMGSMGLVGIVAYGRLLHDRIALLREGGRDPFVQALAVSYLGMVLISLCNPGEFCPFPNAAMMVMLFAQAEEAVGDVAVPVRQLLVRHLGAPAGFLQF